MFVSTIRIGNPKATQAEVRAYARSAAEAKRERVSELHRQCNSVKPTEANQKAGGMFSRYSTGISAFSIVTSYSSANWDKVKDREWDAKLGYEVTQSIMISWLSAKIFKNTASTFPTKIVEGMKVGFYENLSESLIYPSLFNNKDEARVAFDSLAKNPEYDAEVNKLLDYLNSQSEFQKFVDGVGDSSNNFMRVITGREKIQDMSADELQRLDQNAMKDPEVRERMLDLIEDRLYAGGLDMTSGNVAFDRMAFTTGYDAVNVPLDILIGVGSFYAVCINSDSPLKAFAALGTIQFSHGQAAGFWYYRTREELINQ